MQGLLTNLSPALNATDVSVQASNGLSAQNNGAAGGANGVSADAQGFSPLFSNLLSAATQTGQIPFQSQLQNAFGGQVLPLEGQLLPAGTLSSMTGRGVNSLSGVTELKNGLTQSSSDGDSEIVIDPSMQPMMATAIAVNNTMPAQNLPEPLAAAGAVASQLPGQGQNRLQQDLLMRQLAMAPVEEIDDGLSNLRLVPQLETAPVSGAGTSVSNMLRDAMLLKQSLTTGSESKVGDSFSNTLNSFAALSTEPKSVSDTKSLMQASINTPFSQQAGWGEEVGSRVKWMVNNQVQSAELKMNPAHLGPVEVKISVQNDQTTIHFTAQNGAVREALDSAMPRLREMLGDNGVNLADVDVSDQSFAQQQQASEQEREALDGENSSGDGRENGLESRDMNETEEGELMLSSRVVDYYA